MGLILHFRPDLLNSLQCLERQSRGLFGVPVPEGFKLVATTSTLNLPQLCQFVLVGPALEVCFKHYQCRLCLQALLNAMSLRQMLSLGF